MNTLNFLRLTLCSFFYFGAWPWAFAPSEGGSAGLLCVFLTLFTLQWDAVAAPWEFSPSEGDSARVICALFTVWLRSETPFEEDDF